MSERVRVAIRIKPIPPDVPSLFEYEKVEGAGATSGEDEDSAKSHYNLTLKAEMIDSTEVGFKQRRFDGKFQVDQVFAGEMSQDDLWKKFEKTVLKAVFHEETGDAQYGVTLMAYGQTGSGKTYTMMGPEECKVDPLDENGDIHNQAGLALRLAHALFGRIKTNQENNLALAIVTMGMVELYDEKIYDLLQDPPVGGEKRKNLKIGINKAGNFVKDQKFEPVDNLLGVANVLKRGYSHVTMGATAFNERSSRAHTIITLKIHTGGQEGEVLQMWRKVSKVQVVDLAGNEKMKATEGPAKTGPGAAAKLGTADEVPLPVRPTSSRSVRARVINQSLFNLGLMVEAASKGPPKKPPPEHFTEAQKHDYNTKKIQLASKSSILTKLLLDSIGGNSVSFLILAVRDEKQYFSEIKTSLEFGQKCKNVVNKPKETQDAANLQARLKAMEQERNKLREERDKLLAQLEAQDGGSSEQMARIKEYIKRMSMLQDNLMEDAESNLEEGGSQLAVLDQWLAQSEEQKTFAANKAMKITFSQFESRVTAEKLRQRVNNPAVVLPRHPFLLCENPFETGVTVILLNPSTTFSTARDRPLSLGSSRFVEEAKQQVKIFDRDQAQIKIWSMKKKEGPWEAHEEIELEKLKQSIEDRKKDYNALKERCRRIEHFIGMKNSGLEENHAEIYPLPDENDQGASLLTRIQPAPHGHGQVFVNDQEITRDGRTLNHLDKITLGDPKVGARFLFLSPKEVSQSQAGQFVLGVVDHSMPNIQVHQGDQPVEKSTLATPGNQPPYHGRESQADIERQNIRIQDIDRKRVIIQQEEEQLANEEENVLEKQAKEGRQHAIKLKEDIDCLVRDYASTEDQIASWDGSTTFGKAPNLEEEHFDIMISYRVVPDSDFARTFYDKIFSKPKPLEGIKKRPGIPSYSVQPNHAIPQDVARTFLDQCCLQKGEAWEEGFAKAVTNSLVFVPLLSWYEEEGEDAKKVYKGSLGQLKNLCPEDDKIDNFLLEITLANALMELPRPKRWLQNIMPIFMGKLNDQEFFAEFDFSVLQNLSKFPSAKTNEKAAETLKKFGIPVSEKMLRRDVRRNVEMILQFQGMKLAHYGKKDIAMDKAVEDVVNCLPRAVSEFIQAKKERLKTQQEVLKEALSSSQEQLHAKKELHALQQEIKTLKETLHRLTQPFPPEPKSKFCSVQ